MSEADNLARLPQPCDFEIGDVVRLSSSPTEMTVVGLQSAGRGRLAVTKVSVNWTAAGGDLYAEDYDPRALRLVRKGADE